MVTVGRTNKEQGSQNHDRSHPLILFDGVCNLCNGLVRFVIERDPGALFRFSPLQSEAAQRLLRSHADGLSHIDSVVLIDGGRVLTGSDAILRIAHLLGGAWKIAAMLALVPRPVREGAYRFVARHRYRVFGRRAACMVPTPDVKDRFIRDDRGPVVH